MEANPTSIINTLKKEAISKNLAGMARFGINVDKALGVPMPTIRNMAKKIKKNHGLSIELWNSGIHEARILAALIDDPVQVTIKQMNNWAGEFNSWDLCDQCCMNLFDKTKYAYTQAIKWSTAKKEFVKRAGFAIMASLAVHDKKADEKKFEIFFTAIKRESKDNRKYVRKAVNWALRQIGKRSKALKRLAIKTAKEIIKQKYPSAKWIAKDALRELKTSCK